MEGLIAFVGAPGVGKTTAALNTQSALLDQGVLAGYAPEFARDLIARYGYLSPALQLHAMYQQREAERSALSHSKVVLTDTTTWFCYLYPRLFCDTDRQERMILDDLRALAQFHHRHYAHTFYLPLRDGLEDDGIRDPKSSPTIDREMRAYLAEHERSLPNVTYVPEGLDEQGVLCFALETLQGAPMAV